MSFFTQEESYGDKWRINDNVKQMVKFDYLNLMDNFSVVGKFDVIFCRNVLIYFEPDTKNDVLRKLSECLAPGGLLVLGGSETANDLPELQQFEDVRGAYRI